MAKALVISFLFVLLVGAFVGACSKDCFVLEEKCEVVNLVDGGPVVVHPIDARPDARPIDAP